MVRIEGGYKTQTVSQIASVVSVYCTKAATVRALRVYLAAVASVATREAWARSARLNIGRKNKISPRYNLKELSKLTGLTQSKVKKELRALERVGVLTFSEEKISFTRTPIEGSEELLGMIAGGRSVDRPVPLPRKFLRFLCKRTKGTEIAVALLYCVRGLTLTRTGEIKATGSVKASWLAEALGISERSAQRARGELIRLNWISKDTESRQIKLNRTGSYFVINLGWGTFERKPLSSGPINLVSRETKVPVPEAQAVPEIVVIQSVPVVSESPRSEVKQEVVVAVHEPILSPHPPGNEAILSPPYKDKKTPYGSKNQKSTFEGRVVTPPVVRSVGSGVCTANFRKEVLPVAPKEARPNIRNVAPEDLQNIRRVENLYWQGVRSGLIEATEAGALNFVSAACRARRVKAKRLHEAPRVFMGIIRKKLWGYIAEEDEDRALSAIKKYRELDEDLFRVPPKGPRDLRVKR